MSALPAGPDSSGPRLRPILGGWFLLVLFIQSACATGTARGGFTPHPVQASITLTPRSNFAPVHVSDMELGAAFTQLVLDVPLRISNQPSRPRTAHLRLASWSPVSMGNTHVGLSPQDKFTLALQLALVPALEATTGALQEFSAHAMTTLLTGLSLYLVVLMAPEPMSKGLALTITLFLWAYLGHEFWGLISATKQLWDEAKSTHTFAELRGASTRYAQVLGPNTVRILIVLATWKAGSTGKATVTGSGLPGFPQAVRNAAVAGRIHLSTAASDATSASVSAGRLVLTIPAGSGAVLATQQTQAEEGEIHHIATVENEKSAHRGGPWTPRFKKFFDKADMSMEDAANKVRVVGHKGPHPQGYHERVYRRLADAMEDCQTTAQCREALRRELEVLAEELKRIGSTLHKMVAGSP